MVKIKRGTHVLTVTTGAFKRLYQPMGYAIVEAEGGRVASPAPDEVVTPPADENPVQDDSEDPEEESDEDPEEESDEDPEEDDDEEDELDEKPIGEMSFKELKEYASRHGINVNGMTSKQEVRRAIRDARI